MLDYFRLFTTISFLLIMACTVGAGFVFYNASAEGVARQFEKNNVAIAESYIETIWKQHTEAVAIFKNNISESNKADIVAMRKVQDFGKATVTYFKKMPVLRVNIYNAAGSLLISSNINYDDVIQTNEASPDPAFLIANFKNSTFSSQTIPNAKLQNVGEGSVLHTLIPVIVMTNENTPSFQGVIELVTDVGKTINHFSDIQFKVSIFIFASFIIYLFSLFLIVRRSEAIISKQHEINAELTAAVTMAQSENRDKSQFLANISHELRTPLNSIIGFSEIIKNSVIKDMDSNKLDGYIGDIHSSGVHLLSLINDILDYSKAEAGKLELDVAEANLNKLVHNCVRLVTPRAEAAQVHLVEALPKETLNIVTDSKKFKQILLNLLSNAIKFTPAGGEVRITAWADINDDTYMFEVKDSGIGIAPKDISRAMSPFGQVDSTLSRKYEGTGLGLPLTKKFVELMGGKFEIESEVGVGTTIRFSVPREINNPKAPPAENIVADNIVSDNNASN